jgi:hypothetical protein
VSVELFLKNNHQGGGEVAAIEGITGGGRGALSPNLGQTGSKVVIVTETSLAPVWWNHELFGDAPDFSDRGTRAGAAF